MSISSDIRTVAIDVAKVYGTGSDDCLTRSWLGECRRMPFKNTGTLLLTLDCRIAFASTYFCDLVGIEHNKVAGLSWFKFVFPEDMDGARNLLQTAKLPHVDPLRFRLRRLDGTEVWTDIQAANVEAPGGRIYAITATITAVNGNLGGGALMDESYDVFRREADGNFVWLGAAGTFSRAMQKVVQDPAAIDRGFLIVSALTGVKTLIEPPAQQPVEEMV
jgi:PAS domain S-box-containing protein